ncbi:MAG: hypothetical protein HYX51_00025 [Chloroflexi bacterium]|nr:hypothetical protein [Chloroflexota bacterium]
MTIVRVAAIALIVSLMLGCSSVSKPEAGRRVWRGPTANVSSEGITTYDRREIAQRVAFPSCITIMGLIYRFDSVRTTSGSAVIPPGYFDSGYFIDRWKLLTATGPLEQQQTVFVTALGSTGIVAQYPRAADARAC